VEIFRDLIQQKSILSLRRLRLYCGVFSKNYYSCFKKVFANLRQAVPQLFNQFNEDVNAFVKVSKNSCQTFIHFAFQNINSLHGQVALMNAKGLGGEMRKFELVFDFVDELHLRIREVTDWSEFFQLLSDLRPPKDLLNAVPAIVEDISECLDERVLLNLGVGSPQLIT
jgi:hypothetical protein